MRTGLLGGTFDPPHRGHLRMADLAQRALSLDRVFFIPCARQPLKGAPPVASPFHRAAMVALALTGRKSWTLCDLELERGSTSYTVETLEVLRKTLPADELFLILGSDSFASLPQWRRYREITELASLVVVPRERNCPKRETEGAPADRVRWLSARPRAISSTAAREALRKGVGAGQWLPLAVAQYILKHGLYGSRSGTG